MSRDLEELSNYFQTVLKDKKAENATLKQQLAIAVEALKDVLAADTYTSIYAEQALQQIKELEK